jgi:hypothetical protein
LIDKVVEGRDNTQDRDGVITETKDSVKLAKGKGKTGLLYRLAKILVLNDDAANLKIVITNDTLKRTRAILDAKLGTVGLEGRRLV